MHTKPRPATPMWFMKNRPYLKPTSHFTDSYGFKFDWNEPSQPPPWAVQDAINQAVWEGTALHRYSDTEQLALRVKIAKYMGDFHTGNIVLFNGSDAALRTICTAYMHACGFLMRSRTTYSQIDSFAMLFGNILCELPMDSVEAYDAQIYANYEDIDIVYIVNPNNPTGTLLHPDELVHLFDRFPHILFVIDEAYMEFTQPLNLGIESRSCIRKEIIERPNVVVVRTFSKAFRLAGLRMGYTVSNVEIAEYLRIASNSKDLNNLACVAALAAMDDIKGMREYVSDTNHVLSSLSSHLRCQLGLKTTQAGNFVLIKLDNANEVAIQLAKRGIYVRSGLPGLPDHIRVSIDRQEHADIFLYTLKEILGGFNEQDSRHYSSG